MKRVLVSIACVVVLAGLYACVNFGGGLLADSDPPDASETQDINETAFRRVGAEELSGDIKSKVQADKATQGYDILKSGADCYLVVYAGERPTGGYSVEITEITAVEGKTTVTVRETAPSKDAIVTQALTYPFDIAQLGAEIGGSVEIKFVK